MRFSIFQDSSVGGRANNQDRMGYAFTRDSLLMLVADGLGGHFGGEIAAHIAVQVIAEQFQHAAKPAIDSPELFLKLAFSAAHQEIIQQSVEHAYPETPRTTVAACLIQDGMVWFAHAGDSRCYLFRGDQPKFRTRDHSKLETLIAIGALHPSQAENHPDRNKVLNCLGIEIEPLVEVSQPIALQSGDLIFVCTDGVWSSGDDDQFAKKLIKNSLNVTLPNLLAECVQRNGKHADNATAIAMIWEYADSLKAPTDISSDWLPEGALTTNLISKFPQATGPMSDNTTLSDEEIEKTIDEIRNAIAAIDAKKTSA